MSDDCARNHLLQTDQKLMNSSLDNSQRCLQHTNMSQVKTKQIPQARAKSKNQEPALGKVQKLELHCGQEKTGKVNETPVKLNRAVSTFKRD